MIVFEFFSVSYGPVVLLKPKLQKSIFAKYITQVCLICPIFTMIVVKCSKFTPQRYCQVLRPFNWDMSQSDMNFKGNYKKDFNALFSSCFRVLYPEYMPAPASIFFVVVVGCSPMQCSVLRMTTSDFYSKVDRIEDQKEFFQLK